MDTEAQRLIAEAELKAEHTVAVVRMVVGGVLGLAFVLTVVGQAPPDDPVLARQITLAALTIGGYLVLGIMSFAAARPALFRGWMSWVFATLDVGFVLASAKLGLVNAAVSANYTAAFPALWLTPLVLAFGTLRYNPRLQAYVAVLLIGGLALTMGYSVELGTLSPAPPPQLAVLFEGPPNIMRIVMMALAGLVLVIAVGRARGMLVHTIDENRRKARLTRYLPPKIADWMIETPASEARAGRRQDVAVMFVDIRNFTTRAESLDPEALGVFVGEFRRRVSAATDEHGGVIDKFIGDSAMVLFGVPESGPDDAGNALACGTAMLASLDDWNAEREAAAEDRVSFGIGIHWGPVFCGAIGDDARLEYTVLGDAVNVAARLEQETKSAGLPLIVSKDLLDAASASEKGWTALPDRQLRGRQAAIALFGKAGVSGGAGEPGPTPTAWPKTLSAP